MLCIGGHCFVVGVVNTDYMYIMVRYSARQYALLHRTSGASERGGPDLCRHVWSSQLIGQVAQIYKCTCLALR